MSSDNGQGKAAIDAKLRARGRVDVERPARERRIIEELFGMDATIRTEEERERVRDHIKAELKRRRWTVAMAARKFKIRKADIQGALSHKTKQNPDAILKRLLQAINLEPAPKEAVSHLDRFVEIGLVEDIHGTVAEGIDLCRAGTPYMSLVIGPAGSGKSLALQGIARFYVDSVYLCINESAVRPLPFLNELAGRIGLSDTYVATNKAFKAIVAKLKWTYRLLVFDELHLGDKKLLNVIRELMDTTECPIVLAGQPELETMLFAGRSDRSRGATIYRRVGPKLNVEDVTATRTTTGPKGGGKAGAQRTLIHTREDVCKVVQSLRLKIRLTPDAIEKLVWVANYPEGGMLGTAIGVVQHCVRANPKTETITGKLIMESLSRWNTIAEFQQLEVLMRSDPLGARIREAYAVTA